MNPIINNAAISLLVDVRKETEKKQEKSIISLAISDMGIDTKAWKKMPDTAREALLVGYRVKWEESQKGKKCPYCGKYHEGENIPCAECSPKLIEIVKSYQEYEKSLKGDFAVQNAQWLRKDLDFLYAERDARGVSSREGNITKIARVLVSIYESMDESQKADFWESVKVAIVSNNEKPNEAGFKAFLKNNK